MLVAERRAPNLIPTQRERSYSPSPSPSCSPYPSPSPSPHPIIAPTPRKPTPGSTNAKASSSAVNSPIRRPPSRTERKFICTHPGCDKAYFKPSRLAEHQLTHTGERPHQCPHCTQSYLRASHLTAHLRTHLSVSDRPFECTRSECGKRFWTATHLRRHERLHDEIPSYKCETCGEAFHKSHSLRDHMVLIHMPPGTKPYPCPHDGCEWSFATKQQLKTHEKTHDPMRYTCSHPSHEDSFPSFPTWSSLQNHLREAHPPICPYAECHGRVFKSAARLKDHLRVHEEREADMARIVDQDSSEVEDPEDLDVAEKESRRKRKRRMSDAENMIGNKLRRLSGGVTGKDHVCDYNGCTKSFKTKFALASHVKASHMGVRYSCPRVGCDRTFAHKSNLSRHLVAHDRPKSPEAEEGDTEEGEDVRGLVTGHKMAQLRYSCPISMVTREQDICKEHFNRVYDVRRHLKGAHGVVLEDMEVRRVLTQ